jgi:glutamate N-acetyltransferase/amino-acid N-acetyltransferase
LKDGQPQAFDRTAANEYLKQQAAKNLDGDRQVLDQPVVIGVKIGNGSGSGTAWGCDLSYDYVKINAEYTT